MNKIAIGSEKNEGLLSEPKLGNFTGTAISVSRARSNFPKFKI